MSKKKINRQDVLLVMCALIQSGHYTAESTISEVPMLERCDNGNDWKENGFSRKRSAICVEDAIALVDEMDDTIELDNQTRG